MFIEVFQQKLNDTPILPCMFFHQFWFKKQATHFIRTMYMNYVPYIPSLLNVNLENIISLIICNIYKRYLNGKYFPKFLVHTKNCLNTHIPSISILFKLEKKTCRSKINICTNLSSSRICAIQNAWECDQCSFKLKYNSTSSTMIV
jgi:hypothetical protein